MTNRRLFIICIAILLAGIVLAVALAAVATVATQQAQAGRGFILGETAFERQCWN